MPDYPHIEPIETVVSEDTIATFEKRLETRLPEDYRNFMLAHNGGEPSRRVFKYKNHSGPYAGSSVRYFFAFSSDEDYSIKDYFVEFVSNNRMPGDLVPIGTDEGGNLVCIAVKGPNTGKIYFWDHEEEAEEGQEASYNNLFLVADSFKEFLESLQ